MHLTNSDWLTDFRAANPKIKNIHDSRTGQILSYNELMRGDIGDVIVNVRKVSQDHETNPFTCTVCGVKIYLIGERQQLHFRHQSEDGSCPAVTRGDLLDADKIAAMQFQGKQEGERHRMMKSWLAVSLRADPRFSDIKVEGRLTALNGKWRTPDVHAKYQDQLYVFEVQLARTAPDVINHRSAFYRSLGARLIWLLDDFGKVEDLRLMEMDVFFPNNRNTFVVSADTFSHSQIRKKFHLKALWEEVNSNQLSTRFVEIDDLQFNDDRMHVYYYDYNKVMHELDRQKLLQEEATHKEIEVSRKQLRERVERAWLAADFTPTTMNTLSSELMLHQGLVAVYLGSSNVRILLNCLYSLKHAKVVNYDFKKLIEVAHLAFSSSPKIVHYFRLALWAYPDILDIIIKDDVNKKWLNKVNEFMANPFADKYKPNAEMVPLIVFLFPEFLDPKVIGTIHSLHPDLASAFQELA